VCVCVCVFTKFTYYIEMNTKLFSLVILIIGSWEDRDKKQKCLPKKQILKIACVVGVNAKQDPKKTFPKMLILFILGHRTSHDFYFLSCNFRCSFSSSILCIYYWCKQKNGKRM
jgi:hypothetical protein